VSDASEPTRGDRLTVAVEREFELDSLVGSFFHSDRERGWQGCVVAEPAPGIYLLETFDWLVGASYVQVLIRIEDMLEWTFYDDARWLSNHYQNYLERKWGSERAAEREEVEKT
jgi:hypothetical protein